VYLKFIALSSYYIEQKLKDVTNVTEIGYLFPRPIYPTGRNAETAGSPLLWPDLAGLDPIIQSVSTLVIRPWGSRHLRDKKGSE
jgi:hypothetical protein